MLHLASRAIQGEVNLAPEALRATTWGVQTSRRPMIVIAAFVLTRAVPKVPVSLVMVPSPVYEALDAVKALVELS